MQVVVGPPYACGTLLAWHRRLASWVPRPLLAVLCGLLCFHPVQAYFADEQSKGRTLSELYELVQHAGNVLPRL